MTDILILITYLTGALISIPIISRAMVQFIADDYEPEPYEYALAAGISIVCAPFWPLTLATAGIAKWLHSADQKG